MFLSKCIYYDSKVKTRSKLNDIYQQTEPYAQQMMLFKFKGHSKFEAMLLVWSSSTGEMRNHQSLAAHVDGNKSHCIETLSLFSRLKKDYKIEEDEEIDLVDACLLFPLDGAIVKYLCGKQLLHCSLSNTLHLSDSTRNKLKWPCVHGP